MLRGTGIVYDLRKNEPYEIYDKLVFNSVIARHGDSYSRYLVRLQELRESLKIINSCLNKIKPGNYKLFDYKFVPPRRHVLKKSMEAVITHFNFFAKNIQYKPGFIYTPIESPKGELAVSLLTDMGTKPYRCHIRSPGYYHLQGLDFMSFGHFLADVVTIVGTQDIVFGEVDR